MSDEKKDTQSQVTPQRITGDEFDEPFHQVSYSERVKADRIRGEYGMGNIVGDGAINVAGNPKNGWTISAPELDELLANNNIPTPFVGYPWIVYAIEDPSTPSTGYDVGLGNTNPGSIPAGASPISQLSILVGNPNDNSQSRMILSAGGNAGQLQFKSNNAGDDYAELDGTNSLTALKFKAANGCKAEAVCYDTSNQPYFYLQNAGSNYIKISMADIGSNPAKFIVLTIGGTQYYVLASPV